MFEDHPQFKELIDSGSKGPVPSSLSPPIYKHGVKGHLGRGFHTLIQDGDKNDHQMLI